MFHQAGQRVVAAASTLLGFPSLGVIDQRGEMVEDRRRDVGGLLTLDVIVNATNEAQGLGPQSSHRVGEENVLPDSLHAKKKQGTKDMLETLDGCAVAARLVWMGTSLSINTQRTA